MEYITLGRTGLRVSKLAIGTNALNAKYDPQVTPGVYGWLLDQGVNYIGTGNMYGDCQTYLRQSILHRRDEFYLSGKGGSVPAREVLKAIDAGLFWLGIDYFDVWEMDGINGQGQFDVAFGEGGTLEGVRRAQEQGKVRFVGMTSHHAGWVKASIETGQVDTAMFFVNPIYPFNLREVLPAARAHNVGTLGMRPIDHGEIRPIDRSFLWSLHSGVDVIINGMYTMAEAEQNVALVNKHVTQPELDTIRQAFAQVPEHNCHRCGLCKCPFHISVERFALYLDWHQTYGLSESLLETLRKEATRAKEFVAFCDSCGLCDAQCPYDVPLAAFVKRAIAELT